MNTTETFWARVERGPDCWLWHGGRKRGYGRLSFNAQHTFAHRLAWTLTHGPIPDGMCVLHHCDNPPCVRPEHLFLGTVADNNADCAAKGRKRRGSWVDPQPVREAVLQGMTVPQAARATGVNIRTAYRMATRGELAA